MKNSELRIKFTVGAFDKDMERAGLHDCKKYTKHVEEMNKLAEVLDRYDEFSNLTLTASDYAQKDGEYGIPKSKFHTGDERLLPHQLKATQAFLKELRGFGLLADVVGSGKTYEACAVLSELAAKGKISTALIIVPSQVYNTWLMVLEKRFGLGEGMLKTLSKEFDDGCFERGGDGMLRPKMPIIVKTEDFIFWHEHDIQDVLFDVVVVDEAHNLCGEEGSSAKAMKLLSIMMATKKLAKKTYCVLLSATPHAGNLDQMFRLWYFIRCKGGLPSDFDEKEDGDRTEEYRKEKEYYREHICRGTTTVMGFINKVKQIEVMENFADQYESYAAEYNRPKLEDFPNLLEGERKDAIDCFLEDNEKIKAKIMQNIASAYHNGVLRSIMIRQPNDRNRKGKRIENLFFFPATNANKEITIKGLNGKQATLVVSEMNGDGAIKTEDATYSIADYVEENRGNRSYHIAYADLFFEGDGVLHSFGLNDDCFQKRNSMAYYWNQMRSSQITMGNNKTSNEVALNFSPVYDGNVFERKVVELKKILTKHADSRVIVFFDYDVKKSERCHEQVLELLRADANFKDRIIVGDSSDKSITERKFNEKEDAILVVTTSAFTEGANLQKSNVIVNFQVTPNPLGMEQSIGRIFRLGQENDVIIYSFADMTKLEGYVLMYFTRIGLMTSNSGDAAIIAGSNNDNMVTVRCPACGNVKLMSKEDYEMCKKNDLDEIYCNDNEKCKQESERGKLMVEINGNEVKCENCGNIIKRQNSDDGGQYYCLSVNSTGSGVMCNKGDKGDRLLYCRKICAISHCERFTTGPMQGMCEALNYYNENPMATDADLEELCDNCKNQSKCYAKCRVRDRAEGIEGCRNCSQATCFPKPHVIEFDNKWEADCPVCAANGIKGKLKPIVARTFETYIRSAYDYQQDGGRSFCDNLMKEANKVAQIQAILSNDKVKE